MLHSVPQQEAVLDSTGPASAATVGDGVTYPDVLEGRLVGDVIQQEQGWRGRERSHRDLEQEDGCPAWAGEGAGVREGLTLGVSVISVGDAAEPLLPCGVPDLGRDGQMLWWERDAGSWELSYSRFSWASEHPMMSCVVGVIGSSSLLSPGVGGVQPPAADEAQGTGRRGSKPELV